MERRLIDAPRCRGRRQQREKRLLLVALRRILPRESPWIRKNKRPLFAMMRAPGRVCSGRWHMALCKWTLCCPPTCDAAPIMEGRSHPTATHAPHAPIAALMEGPLPGLRLLLCICSASASAASASFCMPISPSAG